MHNVPKPYRHDVTSKTSACINEIVTGKTSDCLNHLFEIVASTSHKPVFAAHFAAATCPNPGHSEQQIFVLLCVACMAMYIPATVVSNCPKTSLQPLGPAVLGT